MIRAKFRCMGVNDRWDCRTAEFLPVTHRHSHTTGEPAEAEENLAFWQATPAGKVYLTYLKEVEDLNQSGQDCPFVAGAYYYMDLEEDEEGEWKLDLITQRVENLTVEIVSGWGCREFHHGKVEMTIDNEAAWPSFVGKVGSAWRVVLTPCQQGEDA